MRSLLTRLAALSVVAFAISGCSGSSETALPIAGSPGSGSQSGNPQTNVGGVGGTGGIGSPPKKTANPLLLDNGTVGNGVLAGQKFASVTYAGFNVVAADAQNPANAATDPGQVAPNIEPALNDLGSHTVTITGITTTQAIIQPEAGTATAPALAPAKYNLTYPYQGQNFDYSTLVAHFALLGGAAPSSISAEFVSSNAASIGTAGFDVRVPCTGTLGPALSAFTCPIPAFAGTNPPTTNTTGPNAVLPGASGLFAPLSTNVYFVLNYNAAPAAGATTTLGIDYVYLTQ